jgi:hypothetical protein
MVVDQGLSSPEQEEQGQRETINENAFVALRLYFVWKIGLSLVLFAATLFFAIATWHWQLVGDAPLLHYVIFLTQHGRVPYRDIVDPNMPGTYLVEWSVIHLFGSGALAWRIFDLGLMAVATVCMVSICLPYDWFAGVFAGGLLTLIHGRDGLIQLGQRDLVMTVLLLASYMFLFSRLRERVSVSREAGQSMLFGICLGFAASIQPTALLLAPPLLVLSSVALHRRRRAAKVHVIASVAGLAIPGIAILAYLLRMHAWAAFLDTVFRLAPYHLHLWSQKKSWLIFHTISSVTLPLVLLWLPVALRQKRWKTWEGAALYCGMAFGILSFIVQAKGFPYHRYPSEAFLLLLSGVDFATVLRNDVFTASMRLKVAAICGLGFGVFVIGVGSARLALRYDWRDHEYDSMLQNDLRHLGGAQLSGQIQCLDMASGCLDTLLGMSLVQSTGTLYDCYMLWPAKSPDEEYYRERFWRAIITKPPRVFVVNDKTCAPVTFDDGPYGKLARWPKFAQYLADNYILYADRVPPHRIWWARDPSRPVGYRIYVKKGTFCGTRKSPLRATKCRQPKASVPEAHYTSMWLAFHCR